MNDDFQVTDRPKLALTDPDFGRQDLIGMVACQPRFEVCTLGARQLQRILALPVRLQPIQPACPVRLTPIHHGTPTTANYRPDRFNRLPAAIQTHCLQALQFVHILRRIFRTLEGFDFLFGEGKGSFCHTL